MMNHPQREREREQLLISGEFTDDERSSKMGLESRPFYGRGAVSIGVPGVQQKSYRFTRWARTYDKAFNLDDTSHFIGILKQKGLFSGFRVGGNGRVAN